MKVKRLMIFTFLTCLGQAI